MNTKVVNFPSSGLIRQPLGWYLRLGVTGHQKLATLQAAGRLPITKLVVDASCWKAQKNLAATVQGQGAELVLDTKIAELSAIAKSGGQVKSAPLSHKNVGESLKPNDFKPAGTDIYRQIAQFAVENNFDRVLSPRGRGKFLC